MTCKGSWLVLLQLKCVRAPVALSSLCNCCGVALLHVGRKPSDYLSQKDQLRRDRAADKMEKPRCFGVTWGRLPFLSRTSVLLCFFAPPRTPWSTGAFLDSLMAFSLLLNENC